MTDFDDKEQEIVPFSAVIKALLDYDSPFPPKYLARFSDLPETDFLSLKEIWVILPDWRRLALIEDLESLAEINTRLSFEPISRFAMDDNNSKVRFMAIRSMMEYDPIDLIPRFIHGLQNDESVDVRSINATILGKFIYLGELDEISQDKQIQIEDALLAVAQSAELDPVRQNVLEALGTSSRKEVPELILDAYHSDDPEWICSALFAMGKSCNPRWQRAVLDMLDEITPDVKIEAARAAGELETEEAIPYLMEMVDSDHEEYRQVAIWSLSQIGGKEVGEKLDVLLEETVSEEDAEFLELALENLVFSDDSGIFNMLDLSFDDEDEKVLPDN